MKRRKLLLFPLLGLIALTSLCSCGEDRWKEYYPLTGRDLWIDSLMREVYLWYEDIPPSKGLNYFQNPETFLKSILSKNDKGFSTVDTIMDIPLPSYGFDYTLYKVATSDTTYNALVSYVANGSPAAEAGLQRGNWIMLVDGDSITKKTEERLTDGGTRTLRIGKYVIVKDEDDEGTEGDTGTGDTEDEDDESIGMIQAIGDIALPAVRPVTESAIHTTKFVQLDGTDHKIAYLAYNTFTAGTAENSEAYNNELRAFSQQCQQFGINNFILDLRYNPGGEMECVQLLADMLVPADKLESPFAFLQYNDKQSSRNHDLILDSQLLQGGANLNLSKVYIITGGTTAGNSIINQSEVPCLFFADLYPLSLHSAALYGKLLGEPFSILIEQIIPDGNTISQEVRKYTYSLDKRNIITSCKEVTNSYGTNYIRTVNYVIE